MPVMKTFNYAFGGFFTQLIWNEREMAKDLGISIDELRWRCHPLSDPRGWPADNIVFACHVRRGGKFLFHRRAWQYNLEQWSEKAEREHHETFGFE